MVVNLATSGAQCHESCVQLGSMQRCNCERSEVSQFLSTSGPEVLKARRGGDVQGHRSKDAYDDAHDHLLFDGGVSSVSGSM